MTVRLIALLSLITGFVLLVMLVPGGIPPTAAQSQQDSFDAAFPVMQHVHSGVANTALTASATTDAENVELVGHIAGRINTVAVRGNYAYIGEEKKLTIVDISNPALPTVSGKTAMLPDVVRSVTVAGDYAYIADGSGGLRVVDISVPTSPRELGFYPAPVYASSVAVDANYAYVAGGWGGLRVVSISDPANPAEVGFCETPYEAYDVAVVRGYAYVAAADWCGKGVLWVVDISNPANPTVAGMCDTPARAWDVAVAEGYAYVASEGSGLRVINTSRPTNLTEVDFHDTPGEAYDVAVARDYAYIADRDAGLRVVDISAPSNSMEVGFYDTPGYAQGIAAAEGYLYVADGSGGLYILRYAEPTTTDTERILFVSDRDGNSEIYSMNADGSGQTNLTNDLGRDHSPTWSPDGTRIAFVSDRDGDYGIYIMNADGSNVMNLANGQNSQAFGAPAWSPDGTRIAIVLYDDVYVVNADGSGLTNLIDDPGRYDDDRNPPDSCPAWSPDGMSIASMSNWRDSPAGDYWAAKWGNSEIYVVNADGSGFTNLTNNPGQDGCPIWSPDGTRILFGRSRSPTHSDVSHEVYVMNADGSGVTCLTSFPYGDAPSSWSPDGRHILFVSEHDQGIYAVNADGTGMTRLTTSSHWSASTTWSPDAERIAFVSDHEGNAEIYVINADGSGLANLTSNAADDHSPSWQPRVSDFVDLSISEVTPIQVLEGQPLVVDKATAVKVVVNKSGSGSVEDVQVRLTYGTEELTSFYVSEPDNWDDQFRLREDNTTYPLDFTATETSKTIYFFGNALAPTAAGPYNVTVEVDPSNLIPETDKTPNTGSASDVIAYEARWGWLLTALRLRYIPVEQPRSQAVINYVETGTDFITSTYPVAAGKLQYKLSTSSFSRICREPNDFGLRMALAMLRVMGFLADPTADRIIGITPAGWLHDNYPFIPESATGYAVWPNDIGPLAPAVFVEMAGIGTIAHEVGHTYELWVGNCPDGQGQREEYDQDCDGVLDDYGNAVYGGLRVSDRTVMNNGDEKEDGARHGVYCFMGTAHYEPPTIDRFVCTKDYQALVAQSGATGQAIVQSDSQGVVLVSGLIGKDDTSELLDWYWLQEGTTDEPEPGPYILKALAEDGEILYEQPFAMTFDLMGTIDSTLEEAPFAFVMPFISGTVEFELQHEGQTLATRAVSAHAPIVEVLTPNEGEAVAGSGAIEWTADDADGDTLTYAVLLSTDNGATWNTAAIGLTTTVHSLDVSALPPGTNNLVKVIATDGINTGQDVSDGPFTIGEVHPDGEEEVPGPQPACCAGLWGLVALPVSMVMLLVRKRSPTQSRDTAQ